MKSPSRQKRRLDTPPCKGSGACHVRHPVEDIAITARVATSSGTSCERGRRREKVIPRLSNYTLRHSRMCTGAGDRGIKPIPLAKRFLAFTMPLRTGLKLLVL